MQRPRFTLDGRQQLWASQRRAPGADAELPGDEDEEQPVSLETATSLPSVTNTFSNSTSAQALDHGQAVEHPDSKLNDLAAARARVSEVLAETASSQAELAEQQMGVFLALAQKFKAGLRLKQ